MHLTRSPMEYGPCAHWGGRGGEGHGYNMDAVAWNVMQQEYWDAGQ